jgi:hypothetical protein
MPVEPDELDGAEPIPYETGLPMSWSLVDAVVDRVCRALIDAVVDRVCRAQRARLQIKRIVARCHAAAS